MLIEDDPVPGTGKLFSEAYREQVVTVLSYPENYTEDEVRHAMMAAIEFMSRKPFKPLEMPKEYVIEMIADWWSFSWKNGNLYEIFDWYAEHRDRQYMHPKTRLLVEDLLLQIKMKLDADKELNGEEIPVTAWPPQIAPFSSVENYILHSDLNHEDSEPVGKVVDTRETENGLEVTVEYSKDKQGFWKHLTEDGENVIDKIVELGHPNVLTVQEMESLVKHSDTSEDDEDLYGVPELKKFPMPDKKHVKSAIRFFNYVDPKYEKELAEAILEKAEEFGLDLKSDISVGDENRFKNYIPEDVLEHTGLKGMKWGIRRFQNYDGSLTEEGKARYGRPSKPVHYGNKNDPRFKQTVFVSGSSKTQNEDSQYYRKELPKAIREELDRYVKDGDTILVGDAPGIDRQVQDYLNSKNYGNVEVYGPGKNVRYSANKKWKTNPIDDPDHEEGSAEWLAKKDEAMAERASDGIAIILDEGAKATRKNVGRLADLDKNVSVFQLDKNGSDLDRWFDESELLEIMDTEVSKLYQ